MSANSFSKMKTSKNNSTFGWFQFSQWLLLAVLGLFAGGCRVVQKADFKPNGLALTRHPLRVAYVVNTNLSLAHAERSEGYVYPIGDYLCPCARHVAHEAFTKATEYDSLDAALKATDADAVLVPKFIKIEFRARGIAWDKRHTLVVLEWSMKNIKDQKTIWLSTVEGRAEGAVGTMFSMDGNDLRAFQGALDDMYTNSVRAFNGSAEIADFARSVTK